MNWETFNWSLFWFGNTVCLWAHIILRDLAECVRNKP
jgi:hypothetical protein